jgi:hypothetical protein
LLALSLRSVLVSPSATNIDLKRFRPQA